jgi:hypothetical protein
MELPIQAPRQIYHYGGGLSAPPTDFPRGARTAHPQRSINPI